MLSVARLSSCALLFLVAFLPSPVKGQDGEAEVGAVTIELMIGPGLSVAGGGVAAWDLYSFPDFSSTGTGIFKSRFIDTVSSPPKSGNALLEWTGSNSAKLLFRYADLDYDSGQFDPFFSTTEGLFYSATHKDESQRSIYHSVGNKIEHEGGLLLASDNGTVVFNDFLDSSVPNISVIKPGGGATVLVKIDDPVPGVEGVAFNGMHRVHVSPTGGVAFASRLKGTGVDSANDWGLFRKKSAGVLELMVREGDAHPEDPRLLAGGVFIDFALHQTGFGFNGAGAAAFTALIVSAVKPTTASSSLWYVHPDSQAPTLIAVSGLPMATESEGTITFNSFVYNAGGAKIPPMVDVAGDIIFFADLQEGFTVSRPAIWRWNGETISKIVDLDSLPLDGVEDGTVTISDVCLSSRGRIAMIGAVDGLAQVIWAQDDQGRFANVITRDPLDTGVYLNENLILNGETDLGKVSRLLALAGNYNDASGGEDGLMPPWWTPEEKLMFSVEVVGELTTTPFLCQAIIGKGIEIPQGKTYIWDEGLSTFSWHTIVNGQTNWVDANGVRWDKPPTRSSAEVIIPKGFFVELHQSVDEIASLDSKSALEMFASLKVREMTSLGDVIIRGDNDLISNGSVVTNGQIVAGNDGVRVISSEPNVTITTKGAVEGLNYGIWATAENGVTIDNAAGVSSSQFTAMLAASISGDIVIKNRGGIASNNSSGISAISTTGDITIQSPDTGNSLITISAKGSGIKAETAGAIQIDFNGNMEIIAGSAINNDWSILADSTGGPVTVNSKGDLSGTSISGGGGGIRVTGKDAVSVKHEGIVNVNSSAIIGESTEGDVIVDGRNTFISAQFGGLKATAPNGKATVYFEGEMNAGLGDGINATAGGDVLIESNGPIQTISGPSAHSPTPGIWTESTAGGIVINHSGTISTTQTRQSPGVTALAFKDIVVSSEADISTLRGNGVVLESSNGNVEFTHKGPIAVTQEGGGIFAKSGTGWVNVFSDDPYSSVASSGDFNSSDGIHIEAAESATLFWSGNILTFGNLPNAISVSSENAGVLVTTKGEVSAGGNQGAGIFVSGSSILTVNVLGGTVSGADSPSFGSGVNVSGGTDNKVNNHGQISSLSFVAIRAGAGNETIDNHGQISGSIDLGEGTNVFENRSGAWLVTHNDLIIGAGNSLNNSGHLQIGERGEEVPTTTMIGDLFLEASSSYHMEIEDTTIEGEPIIGKLIVSGEASIDGEIIIRMQENYDEPKAGDAFTIVEADSLTGEFFSIRVLNGSNSSAEISRKVKVDLSYPGASIVGTVALLDIGSYGDWKTAFFNEADSANDEVSGLGRDPDGDGYNNLAEYALGGSPGSMDTDLVKYDVGESGSTGINTLSTEETSAEGDSEVSISFNWANDVTDADWALERSSDLIGWEPVAPSEIEMVAGDEYTRITATTPIPSDVDGRLFVRVNVVELP